MRIFGKSPWLAAGSALVAVIGIVPAAHAQPEALLKIKGHVAAPVAPTPAAAAASKEKTAAPNNRRPPWAKATYKRFV